MPSTEHLYGIRQGIQLRREPLILATVSRDFRRFLFGTLVSFLLQWTSIYRNNRIHPCYSGCIGGVGETAILKCSTMCRRVAPCSSYACFGSLLIVGGRSPTESRRGTRNCGLMECGLYGPSSVIEQEFLRIVVGSSSAKSFTATRKPSAAQCPATLLCASCLRCLRGRGTFTVRGAVSSGDYVSR